jgi:peptidoglycan/LPS O-acetylase OafA/YrhL
MIKPLTSMRFIAALLVFIYHYRWLDIDFSKWPLTIFWQNLINHGFIGVSFFFVLSGFVLGYGKSRKMK